MLPKARIGPTPFATGEQASAAENFSPDNPTSQPVAQNPEALPDPSPDRAVAFVNGAAISQSEWQREAALDQAMSALAGQPAPSAEATLERMINTYLVLDSAQDAGFEPQANDTQAEQRLEGLIRQWGVPTSAVDSALSSAGLTQQDFLDEIRRLLGVEAYLQQVAKQQDSGEWLDHLRAGAQVSIFTDLEPSPGQTEPAVTTDIATQSIAAAEAIPTPTSLADEPPPDVPSGPLVGQLALDFELQTTSGTPMSLSKLRGQPVAITFWATWCPVCQGEMPALQAAYDRYRQQGLLVLGVDIGEDAAKVSSYAAGAGLTFPLALDADRAVSNQYLVTGVPTTLFLDSRGIVQERHVGPLSEEEFARYAEPLLSPAVSSPEETNSLAPAFSLPDQSGRMVSLADYRDKQSVVLVFYRGQT